MAIIGAILKGGDRNKFNTGVAKTYRILPRTEQI